MFLKKKICPYFLSQNCLQVMLACFSCVVEPYVILQYLTTTEKAWTIDQRCHMLCVYWLTIESVCQLATRLPREAKQNRFRIHKGIVRIIGLFKRFLNKVIYICKCISNVSILWLFCKCRELYICDLFCKEI